MTNACAIPELYRGDTSQGISDIEFKYKNEQSIKISLLLCNAYFISHLEVNLFSQRKLEREKCPISIRTEKIAKNKDSMKEKFIEKNLYILDTQKFQLLILFY